MYWLITGILAVALILIDQLTKMAAVQHLANAPAIPLWNGVLELTYVQNYGIAWGMFANRRWIITALTALLLLFVLIVLIKRWFFSSRIATAGLLLVFSGGVGNLIDRLLNGYVVDFIHYYKWFDFPVFNFADCCISIGAVLILLYAFFGNNEDKVSPKEALADGTVSNDNTDGTSRTAP